MNYRVIYKKENRGLFVTNDSENDYIRFAMLVEPKNQATVSEAVIRFLQNEDTSTLENSTLFSLEMIRLYDRGTYEAIKDRVLIINTVEQLETGIIDLKVTKTDDITPVLFSFSKAFFDLFIEGVKQFGISERIDKKIEIVKHIRSTENQVYQVSVTN